MQIGKHGEHSQMWINYLRQTILKYHFLTPLNSVDKNSSCLRLSNYELSMESDSFLNDNSLSIEESNFFKDINFFDIKLLLKDLLILNHKVVHCSNPNLTESVIWAALALPPTRKPIEGMKFGFKIQPHFLLKQLKNHLEIESKDGKLSLQLL